MSPSTISRLSLIAAVVLGVVALGALVAGSFEYVVFFSALAIIAAVVAFTDRSSSG